MEKEKIKKNASKVMKILRPIGYTIFGILFVFSVILLVMNTISNKQGKNVKLFGYSYSIVVSPSMVDTINVYDIIVIKDNPYDELEVEDIIVYYNPYEDKYISHRIVAINQDGSLTTKGDNNEFEDSFPVTESSYYGEVVKYGKFLGLGWLAINGRQYIFMILIFAFAILFVSEFYSFIKNGKEYKDKEKQEELHNQELIEAYKKELEKKDKEAK